ncbi:hypothetical protein BJ508DRAFT_217698, partial [Ascobolus immersus RN42]
QKAYSTKDSRVVTQHSTNLAIRSLTMGERTGSRILFNLWLYVTSSKNETICPFVSCSDTATDGKRSPNQYSCLRTYKTQENPSKIPSHIQSLKSRQTVASILVFSKSFRDIRDSLTYQFTPLDQRCTLLLLLL